MEFRVKSVIVDNVKSLDHVEVEFPSIDDTPAPTFLNGNNGAGKTTLLEVISLIGHLPCMSQAISRMKSVEARPSMLTERSNYSSQYGERRQFPLHELTTNSCGPLPVKANDWVAVCRRVNPRQFGAVIFTVALDGSDFSFAVLLNHLFDTDADSQPRSITSLLAQDILSDIEFAEHACLAITDEVSEAGVARLTEAIYFGRTYYLEAEGKSLFDPLELLSQSDPNRSRSNHLVVSYVNTDLNDFGRGNDLRESPKSLRRDFGPQIRGRLRVDFDDRTQELSCKSELNRYLKSSFERSTTALFGPGAADTVIQVQKCQLTCATADGEFGVLLTATRGADGREIGLSYLSAGENESFFILLLLLAFRDRSGIILLDEPDLHISPFHVSSFFRAIYEILHERQKHDGAWQLVCASHSGTAQLSAMALGLIPNAKSQLHVLRRELNTKDANPPTVLKCDYNARYFAQLGPLYAKMCRDAQILHRTSRKAAFLSFLFEWKDAVFSNDFIRISLYAALSGVVGAAFAAIVNDWVVDPVKTPDLHKLIADGAVFAFRGALFALVPTVGALIKAIFAYKARDQMVKQK